MKKIITFLTFFFLVAGQEEVSPPPENFLVELNFKIRQERLPGIINYLLNNSLVDHNILTRDIIELSKLDEFGLEEIEKVFKYFNTTTSREFTVDALESFLDAIDMEFVTFYRGLTQKLDLSDTTAQQVLQDLNIDQLKFLMAVVSNRYVYDTLREGVYDQEHVNAALASAEKTGSEVYNAARDVVLQHIYQMNSSDFMELLRENGWNRRLSSDLWKALNITTQDVYDVVKFRNILTAISDALNKNLTIAAFVGTNELAIHERVYRRFEPMVDGVTIKIEVGELEVGVKPTKRIGMNILQMDTIQSRDGYIEITDNYNATENCSYSTFVEGAVSSQNVEVEEGLKVRKEEGLIFNLGSPLTCGGYLYGLAREEEDDFIIFDRFYTEKDPQPFEMEDEHSGGVVFHWLWVMGVGSFMCSVVLF